jgi:hypothetical protein
LFCTFAAPRDFDPQFACGWVEYTSEAAYGNKQRIHILFLHMKIQAMRGFYTTIFPDSLHRRDMKSGKKGVSGCRLPATECCLADSGGPS